MKFSSTDAMDLRISWAVLCTIVAELFLLDASASGNNTPGVRYAQLPVYFTDEQVDIVRPIHSPTALQCAVVSSGNDRIDIAWRKDGSLISNTTTQWILPDGTLHMEALEPHMVEGSYECLAKHSNGTIASRRIHLKAPTLPEFMQHPQDFVAFQGESARLECIADGMPKPVISWVKNGRPLDVNRTRVNVFSGVLQIFDTTQQDDGSYECLATNTAGQQRSQTAKLTIRSSNANQRLSPKLLSVSLDQTAVVFDKVVLECVLTGRPRPAVTWMKQGGATFTSVGRVRGTRYGNLEIRSVQLSDAGTYICSWTSEDSSGTKASTQARLSVLAPPQLVLHGAMELHTVVQLQMRTVRLKCEFEGVPMPTVVWLKNGQVLEPSGRIRIDEWELVIPSTEMSDSGFYQCRGENSVGAFQLTTWLDVQANENAPLPPVDLVVVPLNSTSVRLSWNDHPLNDNRTLAYSIHAFPTKGGLEMQQVVPKATGTVNSAFVWDIFQPFTNYTFYVVAYSGEGWNNRSALVTAMTDEDVPLESPLMEVTPVGPTGLRLRWSELGPYLARGIILQYKILHHHHRNSSYQQNLVNADLREFVIRGLRSETEYDVVVLAATKKGFPMLDSVSWVTVTTEAAKKTGVPSLPEMNISLVSSNSVVVCWIAGNTSRIIGFKLAYKRINPKYHMMAADDVFKIISLDKGADRYIFTELDSYAMYQVTLASHNEFGWSDSITQTFKMDYVINGDAKSSLMDASRSYPPNPPTNIFAESVNSSAMVVRWERPTDIDQITRYTVRYRLDVKEAVFDISPVKYITSPVEMVVIGDLSPHTQYDLSVQTHTSNAIGPFSSVVKCRTEEGIPSEPLNVQLTVYSDTTVQVTWNPPGQSNGVIVRYTIFYTDDDRKALSEWLTKTSSGSSLSSLVSYLKPNTFYYFRLQAATFAGHGPLSDIVHIRTQDPNDINFHDAADLPTSSILSDLDLGIIIGTAIGVTCIILCIIVIIIRDRRCAHHAAPATRSHLANDVVTSCRCHLPNGSGAEYLRETWRMAGGDDDDDFPSVNSVLVENENCDTKGGYVQNGRQDRIPVQALTRSGMCNGIQLHDKQPVQLNSINEHAVEASLSTEKNKAAGLEVAVSSAGSVAGKLPNKLLGSNLSPDQVTSCPVTESDVINMESVDTSSKEPCGRSKENSETDDFPGNRFTQGDQGANESESLLGNSHRARRCRDVPDGLAGESANGTEEEGNRKATEDEDNQESG